MAWTLGGERRAMWVCLCAYPSTVLFWIAISIPAYYRVVSTCTLILKIHWSNTKFTWVHISWCSFANTCGIIETAQCSVDVVPLIVLYHLPFYFHVKFHRDIASPAANLDTVWVYQLTVSISTLLVSIMFFFVLTSSSQQSIFTHWFGTGYTQPWLNGAGLETTSHGELVRTQWHFWEFSVCIGCKLPTLGSTTLPTLLLPPPPKRQVSIELTKKKTVDVKQTWAFRR